MKRGVNHERTTSWPNPFVGPSPLGSGDPLFGRDRELLELRNLLIAERIVLLYSPSGAGKTSLIRAGLIEKLEQAEFHVLPIISLGEPPSEGGTSDGNRFVQSALRSLEQDLPDSAQRAASNPHAMRLGDYLKERPRASGSGTIDLLIFDQFEQVLTIDPTDSTSKTEFFQQLGDVLRDRNWWALFALREDHLAGLDPYRRWIPRRLATTFRLEFLGRDAARAAIRGTAEFGGVEFAEDAADKLVEDLSRVRVQQPDGSIKEEPGNEIEPVQLQVVCHRLWNHLGAGGERIGLDLVEAYGKVGEALGTFYAESVAVAVRTTGVPERTIRAWFDEQLITKQGIRGQVLNEPGESAGLDSAAIQALVDAHLVRAESRRGAVWYELSHDRLIAPILADNDAWYQANLGALQQQARLWNSRGRAAGYLLTDDALIQAEEWANGHPEQLTAIDRAFLANSLEHREAQRSATRKKLLATAVAVATLLLLLAVIALFWGNEARQLQQIAATAAIRATNARATAEAEEAIAQSRRLAAAAVEFSPADAALGLLLGVEAVRTETTFEAEQALLSALLQSAPVVATSRLGEDAITNLAFSADSRTLAWSDETGAVFLWPIAEAPGKEPINAVSQPVLGLAVDADGRQVAWGGMDNLVHLWNRETGAASLPGSFARAVNSVAFDAEGRRLAAGSEGGEIKVWSLAGNTARLLGESQVGDIINGLAFSPDGHDLLAATRSDAFRWRPGEQMGPTPFGLRSKIFDIRIFDVAFGPDAKPLAVGLRERVVTLWDLSAAVPRGQPFHPGHESPVASLALSADARTIASADTRGSLFLTDTTTDENRPLLIECRSVADPKAPVSAGEEVQVGCSSIEDVAFAANGMTLAIGFEGGSVALLDPTGRTPLAISQQDFGGPWERAVLSQNALVLGAREAEGALRFWPIQAGPRSGQTLSHAPGAITSLALDPAGLHLGAGDDRGRVIIWDLGVSPAVGTPVSLPDAGGVSTLAVDEAKLAASGDRGEVVVWDGRAPLAAATPVGNVNAPPVTSAAFDPGGTMLVAGDDDGNLVAWDLALTPPRQRDFPGNHAQQVTSLAFNVAGTMLASAGHDWRILLWDPQHLESPTELMSDENIEDIAFSPANQMLAAGLQDGCIDLWDVASLRRIGVFGIGCDGRGEPELIAIVAVAFTADGGVLVTADREGEVNHWDVNLDSWVQRACRLAGRNLTTKEWTSYIGDEQPWSATCPEFAEQPPATPMAFAGSRGGFPSAISRGGGSGLS